MGRLEAAPLDETSCLSDDVYMVVVLLVLIGIGCVGMIIAAIAHDRQS